jgi:hypothetical protein
MAANDPWTGVTWNVYGGGPDIKPPAQAGQFTLTPVADPSTGATAYYRVKFSGSGMPPPWSTCHLFPRGNVPPAPLAAPLPPWSTGTDALWSAAATTVLQGVTVTTQRLEGDLSPSTNVAALTLVRVANATSAGSSLLAIQLKSAVVGVVQPAAADGTGYGNDGG